MIYEYEQTNFQQKDNSIFHFICFTPFFIQCNENEKESYTIYKAGLYENEIKIENILNIPEEVHFDKICVKIKGECWKNIETLEFPYHNEEVCLILPTQFTLEQLQKVDRQNKDICGYWPATSNNPSALVATLDDIIAYNGEKKVGRIYLSNSATDLSSLKKIFIYYQYTNEPFTLIGSNSSFYYSECSFEKGWNAFAYINPEIDNDLGKARCTTSIPIDFNLCWFFEPWVY